MNGHSDDAARQRESEAILRRLRQETDVQVGATTTRMLSDTRGHFSASDADPNDRIEVIGTRIGRSLGLVGFIVLLFVFVSTYLIGG